MQYIVCSKLHQAPSAPNEILSQKKTMALSLLQKSLSSLKMPLKSSFQRALLPSSYSFLQHALIPSRYSVLQSSQWLNPPFEIHFKMPSKSSLQHTLLPSGYSVLQHTLLPSRYSVLQSSQWLNLPFENHLKMPSKSSFKMPLKSSLQHNLLPSGYSVLQHTLLPSRYSVLQSSKWLNPPFEIYLKKPFTATPYKNKNGNKGSELPKPNGLDMTDFKALDRFFKRHGPEFPEPYRFSRETVKAAVIFLDVVSSILNGFLGVDGTLLVKNEGLFDENEARFVIINTTRSIRNGIKEIIKLVDIALLNLQKKTCTLA